MNHVFLSQLYEVGVKKILRAIALGKIAILTSKWNYVQDVIIHWLI